MTTFVSVGNATQPFNRLIDAVIKISSQLPQPVIIQHGNTPLQEIKDVTAKPFLEMGEFNLLTAESELLILHAGAGSVITSIQSGKIPVVMPRLAYYEEHVDDHQLEFACAMAKSGKVVMVEEPDDLIEAIEGAMKRQNMLQSMDETPAMVSLVGQVLSNCAEQLDK